MDAAYFSRLDPIQAGRCEWPEEYHKITGEIEQS